MGVGSASIGAPPPHRRKTSGQLSWLLLPWNELSYSMGATPEPQHSHRPVSRQRFFDEFSSAVKAINQLNVRQPTWYVDSRTGSSRSPQPTKGMFTGRLKETTQQVSYLSYQDAPPRFYCPPSEFRIPRMSTHEHTEAMFTMWNIEGKRLPPQR